MELLGSHGSNVSTLGATVGPRLGLPVVGALLGSSLGLPVVGEALGP